MKHDSKTVAATAVKQYQNNCIAPVKPEYNIGMAWNNLEQESNN